MSASSDSTVRVWNMDGSSKKILQSKTPPGTSVEMNCVAISPDDKLIAVGSSDSVIRIWETQSGNLVERLRGHQQPVTCVSFFVNGAIILSGNADGTVKQWDINRLVAVTGRRLPVPPEVDQSNPLRDRRGTGRVESRPAKPRRELPDPPDRNPPPGAIVGTNLAKFALRDGERGGINVLAYLCHRGRVVGASASLDGKWIASVSEDHTLCIAESLTGRVALML